MNILDYEFVDEYETVTNNKIKYYLFCYQKNDKYDYLLGFNLTDKKKIDENALIFENYQKFIDYLNSIKEINIDDLYDDNCDYLKKIKYLINVTKKDKLKYCENDGIKISYTFEKKNVIKLLSLTLEYIFGNSEKINVEEAYYNSNYMKKIKENGYSPKIIKKKINHKIKYFL